MADRPILFSAPMVRALLAGTKTQTRRVVKPPHENPLGRWEVLPWGGPNGGRTRDGQTVPFQNVIGHSRTGEIIGCPYGQPGDRLWVRETFAIVPRTAYARSEGVQQTIRPDDPYEHDAAIYREGWDRSTGGFRWRPSIHMPRWASRITLEITGVRVERLQDISEEDAQAEGIDPFTDFKPSGHWRRYDKAALSGYTSSPTDAYASLWEVINGPGSWDANPWVWRIEFRRAASAQGEKE